MHGDLPLNSFKSLFGLFMEHDGISGFFHFLIMQSEYSVFYLFGILVRFSEKMFVGQHIAHMCVRSVLPWLKEQKTLVLSTFLGDHQAV